MDTSLLNVLGSLDIRTFRIPSGNDLCYIYHVCQNLSEFAFFHAVNEESEALAHQDI